MIFLYRFQNITISQFVSPTNLHNPSIVPLFEGINSFLCNLVQAPTFASISQNQEYITFKHSFFRWHSQVASHQFFVVPECFLSHSNSCFNFLFTPSVLCNSAAKILIPYYMYQYYSIDYHVALFTTYLTEDLGFLNIYVHFFTDYKVPGACWVCLVICSLHQ